MDRQLTQFIKSLSTVNLVSVYNACRDKGSSAVNRFSDRGTAEKRVVSQLGEMTYEDFFSEYTIDLGKAGLQLPEPGAKMTVAPLPAEEGAKPEDGKGKAKAPKAPKAPKVAKAPGPKGKQKTPPHLNLRCPRCGYYAKTIQAMLDKARLKCPVDGELLQTKEERKEKRGRPH